MEKKLRKIALFTKDVNIMEIIFDDFKDNKQILFALAININTPNEILKEIYEQSKNDSCNNKVIERIARNKNADRCFDIRNI